MRSLEPWRWLGGRLTRAPTAVALASAGDWRQRSALRLITFAAIVESPAPLKERALGIRPGLSTYRHVPSCAVARRRPSALCSARVLWSLGQTGAGPQHDTAPALGYV
jgi:hypothetical protein